MMTRGGLTKAVDEFVAPSLEPGERIEATLSSTLLGTSWWRAYVMTFVSLGGLVAKYRPRAYAVVVTDRRVFVVQRSNATADRPRSIEAAYPRAGVRVGSFVTGPLSGSLRLDLPNHEWLAVTFPRAWRDQSRQVVEAIGRPN